jgi:hypothetical protein
MGNKRVSQLVELTSAEVSSNDLFLIIDTSAGESKKIQVDQLSAYLNESGSIIAIHADVADVANFVLGSNVSGTVLSASYSIKSTNSDLSQNSVSSSYANTASYAMNGGSVGSGSSSVSSSWASSSLSSSYFKNANTTINGSGFTTTTVANFGNGTYIDNSGFLNIPNAGANFRSDGATFIDSGGNLQVAGTSGFEDIVTSNVSIVATNGGITGSLLGTASYALFAQQAVGLSSSFLVFSPNNGTASYAISAGTTVNRLSNFGIFLPNTQSSYSSNLDNVNISSSLGTNQQTIIEAIGSAILNYTASIQNTSSLNLFLVNRFNGQTSSLDTCQISYNVTPIMNDWDTLSTGSINIPFTLVGQTSLYGNYYIAVTSSNNNVILDHNRNVKFIISSFADGVFGSPDQPVDFFVDPQTYPITFSTMTGGPFIDFLPGLLITGSSKMRTIDISSQSIDLVRYTWKLVNMTDFSSSNNPALTKLDYIFPSTLTSLYCSSCSLVTIADLSNTNLINFYCDNNQLNSLPLLPNTVVNLNCSSNPISLLPNPLPSSLKTLYCDHTLISFLNISSSINLLTASFDGANLFFITSLPNQLQKLIINNNIGLPTFFPFSSPTSSLPISMSYLSAFSCSLFSLPSMSLSMSYLDISHNLLLPQSQVETTTGQLVTNSQISGTFSSSAIGPASINTIFNLNTLKSRGWRILYDGYS